MAGSWRGDEAMKRRSDETAKRQSDEADEMYMADEEERTKKRKQRKMTKYTLPYDLLLPLELQLFGLLLV
ncbi:hypothetical protein POVWA2_025910 [Plasmodium ovale wallikeri]|uniref:Uncharacterized protein n=1 Tax=Plasmodium ovale wallikeri TaxID=864142 RepID=A0A1A8YVZ9_PLAOA|nr:hypothetical protein POVWA1_026080 [Plasmodium ovale wallikeri]SBT35624.1 hypothetical protein POVWA2_025910 [Plasmodium ovale wallikeri]